mmetsp:Transcript_44843/g.72828  ORF Transcript_44843/g.72828 Transcript_44843/m.72828 type:complete len:635 (+) Transcript_44843:85-1989(+)
MVSLQHPRVVPAATVLSVLVGARILTKVSVVRRLCIQCLILAVRCTTPFAVVCALRSIWWMSTKRHHFSLKRLLWFGGSVWAIAEAGFFAYILSCTRLLNSQTTQRWQAVTTHSTEEKRKASMERYLLALTQVCTRAGGPATSTPNGFRKPSSKDSGSIFDRRSSFSGTGTFSNSLVRTGSMLGLCAMHRNEASVDDLLKDWEGHEDLTDDELKRLRWLELASFFSGPGRGDAEDVTSWLRRGNVEEWIAHYWFRGATPEQLRDERPRNYEELRRLAEMVLEPAGLLHLPEGLNPNLQCLRIFTDPLPVLHRPLFVYAGTSLLAPLLTLEVMKRLGFRRERVGGLCYWKRPRRGDVHPSIDLAAPRQTPLVFVHGLGVGLVPYYLFISRLSRRHSGDLYVPEFPFLAMAPWESVPSAREVVAQLQDMLAANGHTAAHFAGHSFGAVVIGWVMKMSPSSVMYTTLMEPAQFLMIKAEALTKVIYGTPRTCYEMLIRYFAFRELFTVNLLCRNFFWEQSSMWPEDLHVPAVIQLAGDDHIVQSHFVRRLLEHERAARKLRRRQLKKPKMPLSGSSTDVRHCSLQQAACVSSQKGHACEPLDILWCDGFFHGQVLCDLGAHDKIFSRMRQMVQAEGS